MKKYLSFGHFGKGTGASHDGCDESLLAEAFVSEVRKELGHGSDYIGKLGERDLSEVVETINTKSNNIGFAIEFHFNAGRGTGSEVVVSPRTGKLNRARAAELSCIISDTLGVKNRGVKTSDKTPRKTLALVDKTACPSMIVELCFIDNDNDMRLYFEHKEELVKVVASFLETI